MCHLCHYVYLCGFVRLLPVFIFNRRVTQELAGRFKVFFFLFLQSPSLVLVLKIIVAAEVAQWVKALAPQAED